jgi:hypothetical protein
LLLRQKAIILYSKSDTVVAEDTFIKVLAFAKEEQKLGIVGVN